MSKSEEHRLKHLEFVQSVINRLSSNSFLLKGWTVVLLSSLFILSGNDADQRFIYIAFIPCLVFWALDGYFLWQERIYRKLYDRIRLKKLEEVDFCMNTKDVMQDVDGWIKAIFSKTIWPFHGTMLLSAVVILFIQMEIV